MSWYDDLDKAVLKIARSPGSPARVLAGPGTGKTFSLMNKIKWLLKESRADPETILLVTFTRVAARDLEKELGRLQVPAVKRIRAGTLHSFCFSTLRRAHVHGLTGRVPRPLLSFEERFLLEDLRSAELGDFYERRRQLKAFEAAWARQQDQSPGWPTDPADRVFQALLYDWLRFHQAMLIGEVIPETLKYVRNNPLCRERSMFDHVLVDEYQDLNRAEQNLIDLLSAHGTLTVAGDEDQSVYESLRHAHPEGIADFHTRHAGTYDFPLRVSQRSPQRIVEMANNLIQNNVRRTRRVLKYMPDAPQGRVYIVQWRDMQSEAEGLADFIHEKTVSGEFDPAQTLVLCSRRQFGYMIQAALLRRNVAAHSFFHQEELKGYPQDLSRSMSQQAFTLLTLLANPGDRVALRCWLGFGHASLRRKQYRCVQDYCLGRQERLQDVLCALRDGELSIPYTGSLVDRYRLLGRRLDELRQQEGVGFCRLLFPPDEEWAEPFRVLIQEFSQGATPMQVFDALRTSITQPELPTDVSYVRIMSLHKSKGLNADNVIVVGCIEGLLPSRYGYEKLSPEEQMIREEEQRRLFYVAITRARQSLVCSSVRHLPIDRAKSMGAIPHRYSADEGIALESSFLHELGPSRPDTVDGASWEY